MTYNKKSVEDIDVAGKRVLVRCDFNVPLKDGVISDNDMTEAMIREFIHMVNGGAIASRAQYP